MRTAVPSAEGFSFPHRFAGICGLVFVVQAILQDLIRRAGPAPNAIPVMNEIQFSSNHSAMAGFLLSMIVVGMVTLYSFSVGIYSATVRRHPAAGYWSLLGIIGAVLIGVFYSLVNLAVVVIAADPAGLAANPVLARLIWHLHNAAFTLNLAAVALALFSFARALTLARMIPRWLWLVSALCSGLLLVASIPVLPETMGSRLFYFGFPGFLCWLLLIAVASIAFLRLSTTAAEASASLPQTVADIG